MSAKKSAAPVSLKPDVYWKLRAQLQQITMSRIEAEKMLQEQQARAQQTMREAGLDPAKNYQLNDADCTAKAAPQ